MMICRSITRDKPIRIRDMAGVDCCGKAFLVILNIFIIVSTYISVNRPCKSSASILYNNNTLRPNLLLYSTYTILIVSLVIASVGPNKIELYRCFFFIQHLTPMGKLRSWTTVLLCFSAYRIIHAFRSYVGPFSIVTQLSATWKPTEPENSGKYI